eukprot:347016-Chlamydomonas_euryale.AAC.9
MLRRHRCGGGASVSVAAKPCCNYEQKTQTRECGNVCRKVRVLTVRPTLQYSRSVAGVDGHTIGETDLDVALLGPHFPPAFKACPCLETQAAQATARSHRPGTPWQGVGATYLGKVTLRLQIADTAGGLSPLLQTKADAAIGRSAVQVAGNGLDGCGLRTDGSARPRSRTQLQIKCKRQSSSLLRQPVDRSPATTSSSCCFSRRCISRRLSARHCERRALYLKACSMMQGGMRKVYGWWEAAGCW